MRDYALNCAVMNEQIGFSPARILRNWIRRIKLARMDTKSLEYLKITEEDRQWAIRLPLSTDPFIALEDRAFQKARKQRGREVSAKIERAQRPQFKMVMLSSQKTELPHPALYGVAHAGKLVHQDSSAGLQGVSR
jgi:hypothetical protein